MKLDAALNNYPALNVEKATVDIGAARILHSVDLSARSGEWLGICGANGAGKTTLIRAIAGRLSLTSGAVRLSGNAADASRFDLATAIGFPMESSELPASLRVGDITRLLAEQCDSIEDNPFLVDLLKTLGLESVRDKQVRQLSSGWRQRLAIYSAFLPLRAIVILDEPFNWLDPITAYRLKALFRRFVDDGFALIICEHDLSTVVHRCDRAVFMASGQICATFEHSELEAAQMNFEGFEARLVEIMSGG